METRFEFEVTADLEGATRACDATAAFLEQTGVNQATAYPVVLAVEELLTNTAKYGCHDGRPHRIELSIDLFPHGIVMQIEDDACEFDPGQTPVPDLGLPLEERPIGGLGLHLVRQMSRRFRYVRKDDRNFVTIEFDLRS